jgi:hypothetical protein
MLTLREVLAWVYIHRRELFSMPVMLSKSDVNHLGLEDTYPITKIAGRSPERIQS